MSADFLAKIDWSRPWLQHVRAAGESIASQPDWRMEINRRASDMRLRNHRGLPIRFVPQSQLPPGVAYETHISHSGCVPTRANLHDFFNALIWLTFPKIKVQLNALQSSELEKSCPQQGASARGKVRDAATIFDENAVLLVTANDTLVEALRGHRWTGAFLAQREAFSETCGIYLFGHALMEKLVSPYKAITGHMWVVQADDLPRGALAQPPDIQAVDQRIAERLAAGLATSDFSPLPILGIPGWWAGQNETFYQDATVFRSKRSGGNV